MDADQNPTAINAFEAIKAKFGPIKEWTLKQWQFVIALQMQFLPATDGRPSDLVAKIILRSILVIMLITVVLGAYVLLIGPHWFSAFSKTIIFSLITGLFVSLVFALILLRVKKVNASRMLLAAGSCGIPYALILASGGIADSAANPLFIGMPAVFFCLYGARVGIWAAFIIPIGVALTHFLAVMWGVTFPNILPASSWNIVNEISIAIAYSSITLTVWGLIRTTDRLQSALEDEQRHLAELALKDPLTGLSNRLQMLRVLEEALLDHVGVMRSCTLFLLDLDRFKTVNDTWGHPAGDALLKQVSERIQHVVGADGHAGRLGGDEFKIVIPDLYDRNRLAELADSITTSISRPFLIEGTQVNIGVSIGIAIAPEHGRTCESLIRNADLALYAVKDTGRGTHCFYDKSMHDDARDRRNLEQDLRTALEANQLHLVYQPQVSTANGEISGYEALLRWKHPVRGNISPAIFIPIAEESGLISQIGEWVLRTACLEVANWPNNVKISVNVSAIQFSNPSFPAIVMNALSSSQLAPSQLELEITESVFLNEGANTNKMFSNLKAIGVGLSLDDFGTGYSSLSYLKKAPFSTIKIDQSFVRGAAIPGNGNAAIVRAIVSLADAFGMETVAEGAETHDELALIKNLGCSHVQGYVYSKPLAAEAAVALMGKGQEPMVPIGPEPDCPLSASKAA